MARTPPPEPVLIKMSALARRSGVPAATIKHYLREGLLPAAVSKTSKNMALYDARAVERIRAIKELQRTKFLPLRVIKGVLDGVQPDTDAETATTIRRVLDEMAPMEARTRKQLLGGGVPELELEFFKKLGVLEPEVIAGEEVYVGDDLQLLRILGEARRAGISAEMLPPATLEPYTRAIRELVEIELRMFRDGVIPRARGNLKELAETATKLSEQLVVVLRRKTILRTLRKLATENEARPANDSPQPKKKKSKQ